MPAPIGVAKRGDSVATVWRQCGKNEANMWQTFGVGKENTRVKHLIQNIASPIFATKLWQTCGKNVATFWQIGGKMVQQMC